MNSVRAGPRRQTPTTTHMTNEGFDESNPYESAYGKSIQVLLAVTAKMGQKKEAPD